MNKVAIVYWSGTGNTEQMAQAVAEGVKNAGGEANVLTCAEFDSAKLADYGAVAFGCPAMGAEQLEEGEFEPMFADLEGSLSGVKVALFGSYGWGSGQWLEDWCARCKEDGAVMQEETWRYGKRSTGRRCNRSLQRSGRKAGSLLSKVS